MVTITVIPNACAIIESDDDIWISDNTPEKNRCNYGNKVALCRCGLSQNGSLCDGSHSKKVKSETE